MLLKKERVNMADFADGRRDSKSRSVGWPEEARKYKEMESSLEAPRGKQPCQHLVFSPVDARWNSDPQAYKIKFSYCASH